MGRMYKRREDADGSRGRCTRTVSKVLGKGARELGSSTKGGAPGEGPGQGAWEQVDSPAHPQPALSRGRAGLSPRYGSLEDPPGGPGRALTSASPLPRSGGKGVRELLELPLFVVMESDYYS